MRESGKRSRRVTYHSWGNLDRGNRTDARIVDKGLATESHPVPLLFVHGACHAAWCWDEHFLDFFADKGYRAVALSLRGHGASSLSKPLKSCSIADYVDDVHAVVGNLGSPPVLIGHSMGGFVVQNYSGMHGAPAGVIMAPGTPQGLRRWDIPCFPPSPVALFCVPTPSVVQPIYLSHPPWPVNSVSPRAPPTPSSVLCGPFGAREHTRCDIER